VDVDRHSRVSCGRPDPRGHRSGHHRRIVCLVHGLGVSHRYFVPLWRLLPGARCPDLAGDDVPTLTASLERSVAPATVLVANSLGAQLAVELAVRRPDLVAALVLIGPTGDPERTRLVPQAARLLACALLEPPRLVPLVARDYARWGVPRLLRTARSMLERPLDGLLERVEAPVTVVRGVRDPICSVRWAERLASGVAAGRLVAVPRAAHAVHWSHPALVARIVEEVQDDPGEGRGRLDHRNVPRA
jgi:pimeloyl-ACP methyl ester carboxylesterase